MGKPYLLELRELESTYSWANSYDVGPLVEIVKRSALMPLIAVGSGGSISAAESLCALHTSLSGSIAKVLTPLEAVRSKFRDTNLSIWFLSASGSNPDIIQAYEKMLALEPAQMVVICGDSNSQLSRLANESHFVELFTYALPSGRDGFLATNSLLAVLMLLSRSYASVLSSNYKFPPTMSQLRKRVFSPGFTLSKVRSNCEKLWDRQTIVVIYSAELKPIAVDLESKFTEAALGNVQIADMRNFAHGRHFWLAKHGDESGVIALSVPSDSELVKSTLALLPSDIPVLDISVKSADSEAIVGLFSLVLNLVGWVARVRGVDPGKPSVPVFGEKIFNLTVSSEESKKSALAEETIVFRKSGIRSNHSPMNGDYEFWKLALYNFKRRLKSARFPGIVFDYDGTLVDSRNRFHPPIQEMSKELTRLLEFGLPIGVATGRGKSVRRDLQTVIPKKFWERVLIGYYNGAEIASLNDNRVPKKKAESQALQALVKHLEDDPLISRVATVELNGSQLTVFGQSIPEDRLWEVTNQHIESIEESQFIVLRSSHSIDVLPEGISKLNLVEAFSVSYGLGSGSVLTIGDRGKWPGNDYQLLAEPYSLSVDEVSADPKTCWNLAPPGIRGVQATISYCKQLIPVHSSSGRVKVRYGSPGV